MTSLATEGAVVKRASTSDTTQLSQTAEKLNHCVLKKTKSCRFFIEAKVCIHLVAHIMTKRRAENVLPPEVLHKRCFRSLSDNDKPFGGVNVIQNANPPTLLSVAGQRCRKRTSYREDSLDTDNLPRKVAANRSACKSRTFEDDDDAGRPVTRRSSRALQTESKKQTDEGNNITARDKVKFHTNYYKHLSANSWCVASGRIMCNDGR